MGEVLTIPTTLSYVRGAEVDSCDDRYCHVGRSVDRSIVANERPKIDAGSICIDVHPNPSCRRPRRMNNGDR